MLSLTWLSSIRVQSGLGCEPVTILTVDAIVGLFQLFDKAMDVLHYKHSQLKPAYEGYFSL